jgi:unsaturated rhamnogalacturonyl hydrolase
MKKIAAFLLLLAIALKSNAQTYAEKMASTVMTTWKDTATNVHWNYDEGVYLKGIEGIWKHTGDGKYFTYMKNSMDVFVDKAGNINTYKLEDYNIDNVLCGRILLSLYAVTGEEKYYKVVFGTRKGIPTKCGWMVCIWANRFMQNMPKLFMKTPPLMI